jgi:hypothetical protein
MSYSVIFSQPAFLYQRSSSPPGTTAKKSIFDSRLNYWDQAWLSIKSRPIFGSGPGTFYLTTKKFLKTSAASSWYAHNFALETLSESGVIGLLGLTLIVGYPLAVIVRSLGLLQKDNYIYIALWQGLLLVLIYSFFEMILNFLVIWLLFWAVLGFLYRRSINLQKLDNQKQSTNFLIVIFCICLIIYYLTAIGATLFDLMNKNSKTSFILQPYAENRAITYITEGIKNKTFTWGTTEKMIIFFHKKNPEIAFNIARYTNFSSTLITFDWYALALDGAPQNQSYLSSYLDQLVTLSQADLNKQMVPLLSRAQRRVESSELLEMENLGEPLGWALKNFYQTQKPRWSTGYAGLAYILAMQLLPDRPDISEQLLLYARDISPDIGFIHIELARFYEHIKNSRQTAVEALNYCQQFQSPKKQCQEENLDQLNPPGEFVGLFTD